MRRSWCVGQRANVELHLARPMHAKIGELTLENDFLSGALGKAGLRYGTKVQTINTFYTIYRNDYD